MDANAYMRLRATTLAALARQREAAAKGLARLLTKKKAPAIWVGPDEIRALPIPEAD